MKQLILVVALINLLNVLNFAQGGGALASLTMQRSLPLIGAGNIGAAKANNDPIGYYLNPAILGYTSQSNHASIFFMPSKTEWIPDLSHDITLNTIGFNVGYNLENFNIPISVGFGYMHDKLSYEMPIYSSDTYPDRSQIQTGVSESYDSFDNFSFGIGIDYYVLFNLGLSIKSFESTLSDGSVTESANGVALDYGAMLITPISKLFFNSVKFDLSNNTIIKPLVNFTVGYSLSNVGDDVVYIDEAQADPLSRTERLGYTFDFGFDTYINSNKINIITYSFTAEAEDLLLNEKVLKTENGHNGYSYFYYTDGYQSIMTDININKHLIQLEGDDNVIVRTGHTINIFETITITTGIFFGRGYQYSGVDGLDTKGYGFSSEGLLKLWSYSSNNPTLDYIAKHFVVEYYDVTLFDGSDLETDMNGIALHMNNIEL